MGQGNYVKLDCMECPEMDGIPEDDLVWLKGHNLDLVIECRRCPRAFEDLSLADAQFLLSRELAVGMTCKECGSFFLTPPTEVVWLLENKLKMFKRCPDCRQKNKDKAAQTKFDLEAGLEECARILEET